MFGFGLRNKKKVKIKSERESVSDIKTDIRNCNHIIPPLPLAGRYSPTPAFNDTDKICSICSKKLTDEETVSVKKKISRAPITIIAGL